MKYYGQGGIERHVHPGWKEYVENILPRMDEYVRVLGHPPTILFGKFHYRFDFGGRRVSLIQVIGSMGEGLIWEIYSWDTLFEGTEQYKTLGEALRRIQGLFDRP